jgi:ankyrin repeat protein
MEPGLIALASANLIQSLGFARQVLPSSNSSWVLERELFLIDYIIIDRLFGLHRPELRSEKDNLPLPLRSRIVDIIRRCQYTIEKISTLAGYETMTTPSATRHSPWATKGKSDVEAELKSHRQMLQLAVGVMSLTIAHIKEDTERILNEIARLKSQFPLDAGEHLDDNIVLKQYLEWCASGECLDNLPDIHTYGNLPPYEAFPTSVPNPSSISYTGFNLDGLKSFRRGPNFNCTVLKFPSIQARTSCILSFAQRTNSPNAHFIVSMPGSPPSHQATTTPLLEACWAADVAFVQALLQHGADANPDVGSPLGLALISDASPQLAAFSMKKSGGDEAWDPSICDALLGAGARLCFPPAPRQQQQQQKSTATPSRKPTVLSSVLSYALSYARTHLPAKVAPLLRSGADPHVADAPVLGRALAPAFPPAPAAASQQHSAVTPFPAPFLKTTVLSYTLSYSRAHLPAKVAYLLSHGADPRVDCPLGWMLLQHNWDSVVARLLLKAGADVEQELPGWGNGLPLQKAVVTGNVEAVRFLVEAGAEREKVWRVACRIQGGEWMKLVSASAVELVRMEASLGGAPGCLGWKKIKTLLNA